MKTKEHVQRFKEQVQSTSLFLSCQNKGISIKLVYKSYLMFDHFFCIYIVVLVSLYCCFGGWMQVRVYLNFYF